ncbi:hypothetical protein K2173_000553 [Erythroxylum novogranatense]|uniref:Protein ZIP4 homolog n=1 Tax=Erythroxylum novogranatense TaxID=1862640 RepID=A0AAV8S7Y4_9ROSI|nr:hypothetical protein K2173_000553 [Erythroxylum novogranatense]
MRIAELSSPDSPSNHHNHLLSQIDSLIKQIEPPTPTLSLPENISSDLRQTLTQLLQLSPYPNSLKLHIWKLSYRLWNACVDISNAVSICPSPHSSSPSPSLASVAMLRHIAADMLSLAVDVTGVPSPVVKSASFYYKTGLVWNDLRNFELASTCFERATDTVSKLDASKISDAGERKLLMDLNLARSRTAWEASDRSLALTLLNRAKSLLFGSSDHLKLLASQYLAFGKNALSKNDNNEGLKLMNEALELYEKGLSAARTRDQTMELKELRSKTLRFISAVHLQKGEYENVIKCVRVLRQGNDGEQHASLPVLAMKAWLGLSRYGEAENELRSMVVNKGIPERVWVSAVEAYFEAAGTAGAETAKGVFLGLLGRCHVSAGSAVRVVHRVVGDADAAGCVQGSEVRAKVVADLVSDERVVALFAGDAAAKERMAMHAILWNCGSGRFRSKDYETSAEMFEKSLLYVPSSMGNRALRAKGFRVLCLCYLGLSLLDRAQEYINEAEKLEPNVASSFLKFKINLERKDHVGAINQIEAMKMCLDFTPDFLSLSAHEAVACHAFPVAVASLSNLLNFYTSGKPMPTTEVVVLRTLVTILSQGPGNEPEVLKFMKRAHARVSELGTRCFFGKDETGKREQNWFAVTSWNFGTQCGKEKKYELCADFLRLVPDFYDGLLDGEISVTVFKSLVLTVSAMIASENQKQIALVDDEVKQAVVLLDTAWKILTSISMDKRLLDDQITGIEPELFFMYTFNALEIHGRIDNSGPLQLLLVKKFVSSNASNPKYLLQIGLCASQGPRANHEVAVFALNESLSALLSSPSPNYKEIALILRRLIAVSTIHKGDSDDDSVHNIYKQAYRIMVGLKVGEYPTDEGKWLALTAWNRAALPMKLGKVDTAKKWMSVGLELAEKVDGMETYKACMTDFLTAFEKNIQLQTNG